MDTAPIIKILLVDDVPANLTALEAVLEAPDYELVKACSGAEALRRVEEEDFAAIVMDIFMPGLDGYETARRIKRLPRGQNVPIVLVTAVYKEEEDVRRGYEAGALDYFGKPLDPGLIKAKVRIYAELRQKTELIREQARQLSEARAELRASGRPEPVL